MNYRSLTAAEITALKEQGCSARDWADILVADPFILSQVNNVRFTGKVYLGADVTLENIRNLGSSGNATFGNGIEVSVLKEDGGLEVVLYDGLTSMEAAFEVIEARKEPELVAKLHEKAHNYAASIRSDGSIIESGCYVSDVRELKDVHFGPNTKVIGAVRLVDVSVVSLPDAPSFIGDGVILEHVIILSDSKVEDAVQMDNSFVGQGCHIGRLYSSANSLFFANCFFENGEACAYFAGPYSVSHHKATLMIGCMTSFFNAGSVSNQSNHSYKTGPNKYGQLQRGCKLGSSSYVYWPMQVGVFSTVIGHHTGHEDLRELPFSLVTEDGNGQTIIVPGQNLGSVGTRRDANKWPKRDKRSNVPGARRDQLNFTLFNPFSMGYVLRGMKILKKLKNTGETDYQGCSIHPRHIKRGLDRYQQAIDMYVGQQLQQFDALGIIGMEPGEEGSGDWVDYGGMLVPRKEMLEALRQGKSFEDLKPQLPIYEYNWLAAHFDIAEKESLIEGGKSAQETWNAALDADGEMDAAACNIDL
jgi:hypothetical protein